VFVCVGVGVNVTSITTVVVTSQGSSLTILKVFIELSAVKEYPEYNSVFVTPDATRLLGSTVSL
jgi:hypothetical protein